MPITINGTGNITGLTTGGLPDATITQAEIATGVAGTGPAFSAYNTSSQTGSAGTFTKCALNIEAFDTANCFDSTTNYRFTPTIAGYYQLSAKIKVSSSSTLIRVIGTVYKNGSTTGRFFDISGAFGTNIIIASGSELLYMNGSTDYVELYVYVDGLGSIAISGGDSNTTYFNGSLVRAA